MAGDCVAAATHGALICHLLRSLAADLDPDYWRRIRNPHIFAFDVQRSDSLDPRGCPGRLRG